MKTIKKNILISFFFICYLFVFIQSNSAQKLVWSTNCPGGVPSTNYHTPGAGPIKVAPDQSVYFAKTDSFMRFNNSGQFLFNACAGYSSTSNMSLSIDPIDGDVYVSGSHDDFMNTVLAEDSTSYAVSHTLNASTGYVIKYNSSNMEKWATCTIYTAPGSPARSFTSAVDKFGNVFLGGECEGFNNTGSIMQPDVTGGYTYGINCTQSCYQPAVYMKFNQVGHKDFGGAFCGGSAPGDFWDNVHAMATDCDGNLFMGGYVAQEGLPSIIDSSGGQAYAKSGGDDLFFSRFDILGNCTWATCFGGSTDNEEVTDIATDHQGNVYAVGYTASSDFPWKDNGGYFKVGPGSGVVSYIAKFRNDGKLIWCTAFAPFNNEMWLTEMFKVAVSPCDKVFITGRTSGGIPLKDNSGGYFQSSFTGSQAPFIAEFDKNGTLEWSTYFGNDGGGTGIDVDASGNVFMSGYANIPTHPLSGAYNYNISNGSFIAKFSSLVPCNSTEFTHTESCPGEPMQFTLESSYATYLWTFGDQASSSADTSYLVQPLHTFSTTGTYTVTLHVTACFGKIDSLKKEIVIKPELPVDLGPDVSVCSGTTATLSPKGTYLSPLYLWTPGSITTPSISISSAGKYKLQINSGICVGKDSVNAIVVPLPVVNLGNDTLICNGAGITLDAGNPGSTYLWVGGQTSQKITTAAGGAYLVNVTNNIGCSGNDNIIITTGNSPVATAATDATICSGKSAPLAATGGGTYQWTPAETLNDATSMHPSANPTARTTYIVTVENECGTNQASVTITVNSIPLVDAGQMQVIPIGSSTTLSATVTTNSFPVIYSWSPTEKLTNPNTQTPKAAPEETTNYTVTVTDNNSCTSTDTVTVKLDGLESLYIPNTFTPNNDRSNDKFSVYGFGIKEISIKIFDRWGQLLYHSSDVNQPWDGTFHDQPCVEDIYICSVNCAWYSGRSENINVQISLIR